MELRQYLAVIWKWLWLIVLATAVAAGSTYLATRNQSPIYRTKATVMVGQVISDPDPTSVDFYAGQQLAHTYAELTKREPVMRATVDALGLTMSWQALAGRVSVQVVEGTQLLEISVVDTDPLRAQILANEVTRQLILQSPTNLSEEEQRRRAFMEMQASDLEGKIENAQSQIDALEADLADATSARQMQDLQGQIGTLQNQVQSWQNTYVQLMALLGDSEVNYLSVVEPAVLPGSPVGSSNRQNIMLAAAVGLVLAVGAAFLIEYLDDTVKTPEDVARATGMPTLTAISRINGREYVDKLIALREPLSPVVEAYRKLRTNIQFSSVDRPLQALMITSPSPTEGKSVTLANLAVVMAQSGLKVVAVDADLRRPVLHKIFGISNRGGVTSAILRPNPGAVEHLKATEVENLWVLPSGTLPPNPAEVLGSDRMADIIEELKGYADVVLFDSPPALIVSDAVILSTRMDGVLLVNDAGSTRRNMARKAVEELQQVKANVLGVVLNRLPGGRKYYYYYYASHNGERQKLRWQHRPWMKRWLPFLGNGAKKPNGAHPDVVEEEIGTRVNADTR